MMTCRQARLAASRAACWLSWAARPTWAQAWLRVWKTRLALSGLGAAIVATGYVPRFQGGLKGRFAPRTGFPGVLGARPRRARWPLRRRFPAATGRIPPARGRALSAGRRQDAGAASPRAP